ncbi:MAG: KamA family radical SAM protein [bacterium]
MVKPRYITKIDQVDGLTEQEKTRLERVTKEFAFRANEYYLSLIDWNDPADPIRRLVIPDESELELWGALDASRESEYTKVPGLEHKYNATGLLLVNDVCGAYCRFCFRKRIFMAENDEVVKDVSSGIEYIKRHKEMNNVLPALVRKYSSGDKRIYFIVHFNHPHELTDVAVEGLAILMRAGAVLVNQTPLIAGVNDDPFVLSELFNKLSFIGVPPYYVFQCRPTLGNKTFSVPLERAYEIFEQGRMNGSGLARRARFVMSHATGKIEVVGLTRDFIHFKYLRAHYDEDNSRFLVFERNPDAHWFDDYDEAADVYAIDNPFQERGDEVVEPLFHWWDGLF